MGVSMCFVIMWTSVYQSFPSVMTPVFELAQIITAAIVIGLCRFESLNCSVALRYSCSLDSAIFDLADSTDSVHACIIYAMYNAYVIIYFQLTLHHSRQHMTYWLLMVLHNML